jgi:membrane associated rhomboid family serine protease
MRCRARRPAKGLLAGVQLHPMPGRFRFSVPSNRDRSDPWFRVGTLEVTTTILVTALCVLSIFVWAADKSLLVHTFLWPDRVTSGQVWRLVTWPVTNDLEGNNAIWKAVSIALFWYFGREIESHIGRNKMAWLLVAIAVLAGLTATVLDVGLLYIRSIELALFVVFVIENPRRPFFFGIPAWILAVVLVGIELLQYIADRVYELILVLIVTMATAIWGARSFGMLTDLQWLPQIKLPKKQRRAGKYGGAAPRGKTSGQVVVDGPWPTTPVYRPMQDQAEVDQILDKIAVVGMDGLTAEEKKRLNDASKRLRKQGY